MIYIFLLLWLDSYYTNLGKISVWSWDLGNWTFSVSNGAEMLIIIVTSNTS